MTINNDILSNLPAIVPTDGTNTIVQGQRPSASQLNSAFDDIQKKHDNLVNALTNITQYNTDTGSSIPVPAVGNIAVYGGDGNLLDFVSPASIAPAETALALNSPLSTINIAQSGTANHNADIDVDVPALISTDANNNIALGGDGLLYSLAPTTPIYQNALSIAGGGEIEWGGLLLHSTDINGDNNHSTNFIKQKQFLAEAIDTINLACKNNITFITNDLVFDSQTNYAFLATNGVGQVVQGNMSDLAIVNADFNEVPDGSITTFTLNTTGSYNNIAVFVNGQKQKLGVNYTIGGVNSVTFTTAPLSGDDLDAIATK